MGKIFAVLFLTALPALAQNNSTAYDALRTMGNQLDRDAVNRVIAVSGVNGNPQPATWHILLADPNARGGVREVEVTNGQVKAQRTPERNMIGSAQGATIDTHKLNLDSSGAYEVASHTADTSHVPFALVNYTLRTDEHGNPTWIVTLHNPNSRALGTVYIGANKGTVMRTEGMFQGLPHDAVVQESSSGEIEYGESQGSGQVARVTGPIKQQVREMFVRARDSAQETFKRVRQNFADFIRGQD